MRIREFVGVKSMFDAVGPSSLKQDALMFKRIAIPDTLVSISELSRIAETFSGHGKELLTTALSELEFLLEKGIVFEPKWLDPTAWEGENSLDTMLIDNEQYKESRELEITNTNEGLRRREMNREEADGHMILAHFSRIRRICVQLRESDHLDAYPSLSPDLAMIYSSLNTQQSNKNDVVQIALNALPLPDESVPWEQIIDYRTDPASEGKFLALRNWMNDIARANLTQTEIEEKLEWLAYDYQRHLKFHKLKTNVGTIESIVVTTAEILEDLIRLKWGKVAKTLFSLKRRRLKLLEGELNSPGSEVAYILDVREKFPDKMLL